MGRRIPILLSAAVASSLIATAAGQGRPSVSAVHTVLLDTIVTDARGAAVATLAPHDFEVLEDGKLQVVEEAPFVKAGAVKGAAARADAPKPVVSAADEAREAHRNGTRLVAIYLDEYHIAPGASVDRARDALVAYLDRDLGPDDLVAVLKPLDSLLTIRFTHDLAGARRTISALEGRKGDYAARTPYERNFMAGTPARVEAARTQVGISALDALAVHMGSLNDFRKTLLVASEGFDRPPRRRGQEYLATIESVTRSANRANVSIYPIDPRPAEAPANDVDVVTDGKDGKSDSDALPALAAATAGRAVAPADDLVAAVTRIAADANAYYMLEYRSAHAEDGTFHPVQVRVKRAGLQIRARSGYWAPSAGDRLRAELLAEATHPRPVAPPEPAAHSSPLIRPWFGWSLTDDGKTRVTFVWEPSLAVPGDRGRARAARVELTVLADGDAVLFKGPVLPTGPGAIEEPGGDPSRAVFNSAPGRLRVRMTIEDASGKAVDSDVRSVQVNDSGRPVSIGTPEVLRARNALEFRTLDADPEAVPVSSREFSRTERLLIRFPAYGPAGQPPAVTATLMTRLGQAMRPLPVGASAGGAHQIDIPLAGLAAGDYLIQFTAKSAAGEAKDLLGFRVTS